MQKYESYYKAERDLIWRIINDPEFVTASMYERLGEGFILTRPYNNENERSNYQYADAFFRWLISGEKKLSKELLTMNPWVGRFVSEEGLPSNFSTSYGYKIKQQLPAVIEELKRMESRRAYLNILYPEDSVIRTVQTTHEYPCTIGLHFFVRDGLLHLIANMRSNNCVKVLPYDVYNFTRLQQHIAETIMLPVGYYYHQINSAHIYKGDVRRWKQDHITKY